MVGDRTGELAAVVFAELGRRSKELVLERDSLVPVGVGDDTVGILAQGIPIGCQLWPEALEEQLHVCSAGDHLLGDQQRVLVVHDADQYVRQVGADRTQHAGHVRHFLRQIEPVKHLDAGLRAGIDRPLAGGFRESVIGQDNGEGCRLGLQAGEQRRGRGELQ